MITNSDTPAWLNTELYPFKNQYINLKSGRMHYIDEGKGDTILFVHGTPTWSFFYREFIKALSDTNRCIAIDHIGFGLSEKPKHFSGTPEDHAKNLEEFIRKMALEHITLVVHDFGGPIGLSAGLKMPEKIKRIIMFNTWLWGTKENKTVQKIDKTINSWLGRFLYLNLNFSPKILLKQGFHDKKKLSKLVHKHYIKPFPNKDSRLGLLNLAKALAGSSDWYDSQWQRIETLKNKEWSILWGTKDQFITMQNLNRWKKKLEKAHVKTFECGHFVQEEQAQEAITEIKRIISE